MELCFGGGQIGLGFAGFVLGFAVLTGLKMFETHMSTRHSAILKITGSADGLEQAEIASLLLRGGICPQNLLFRRDLRRPE
jgi:putative Mg2+ transporter-C (MgtC) family protein